jgi:nucleoside diphosphate kinase
MESHKTIRILEGVQLVNMKRYDKTNDEVEKNYTVHTKNIFKSGATNATMWTGANLLHAEVVLFLHHFFFEMGYCIFR